MSESVAGRARRDPGDQADDAPLQPLTLAEKVDPATAALLVIDVQNDYNHPDGYAGRKGHDVSVCRAMVPRLLKFVDAARAAGVMVIHTRNWHRRETDSAAWLDRLARGGRTRADRAAIAGTWGAEFYEIVPLPGEEIVSKFRYDAFLGTNLEYVLRARGIRSVICTGTTTDVCVESTARAALMRDFHLVVVEDCCAAPDLDAHRASLKTLGRNFGEVTTADRIEAVWAAGTGADGSGAAGSAAARSPAAGQSQPVGAGA
jgi:ureidoacrylate peracid hydrolase